MTSGHPIESRQLARFPHHAAALDRHLLWAMDHAAVGERDASEDALLDLRAVAAEIIVADASWRVWA
jgi:hypothetical protein